MNILALDLGTKTGWAIRRGAEPVQSGTWLLATEKELRKQRNDDKDRCCDIRFGRLQERIESLGPVDWIYFEDVQFLSSQMQSQLWAGFRTVITLTGHNNAALKLVAVPVGTLKKFATGKGNAKKEDMLRALYEKEPLSFSQTVGDDNEVDAIHLLRYATNELKL